MTEYRVVDGIASTPKGQQLYDIAVANQNARDIMNAQHTVNLSTVRYASGSSGAVGVSNRPTPTPTTRYDTKQDLINRGFPTVDGIPTPVTFEQAKQQGFSISGKGSKYTSFFHIQQQDVGGSGQNARQSTQEVLDRQEIYRQITGKPTFAYHGCDGDMCPQWNFNTGKLSDNKLRYIRRKLNNQPVETSVTMFEGLPKTAYERQPKLTKPIVIPPPTPEPEIIAEPIAYSIPLIAGVVIVILLLLRRKNA